MTAPDTPKPVYMWETADLIVRYLREAGFSQENEGLRQHLALIEEIGECVGAFRRWQNLARREGSAAEFLGELADVQITTYVTGVVLSVDRWPYMPWTDCRTMPPLTCFRTILSYACQPLTDLAPSAAALHLRDILYGVTLLQNNLIGQGLFTHANAMVALHEKVDLIMSRGWKDGDNERD